jgi:hypothetical protein
VILKEKFDFGRLTPNPDRMPWPPFSMPPNRGEIKLKWVKNCTAGCAKHIHKQNFPIQGSLQ